MLICVVGVVAVMLFHEALIGKPFHITVAVGGTIRLVNVKAVFRTFLGRCVCGSWFLLSGGGGGGNGVSLIGSLGQKLGSSVLGARQEYASVHVTTTFLDSSWNRNGTGVDLNLEGEDEDQQGKGRPVHHCGMHSWRARGCVVVIRDE
ncbi:hypothetical protein F5H01DRAFT_332351 [Linnemannia elongata]|nr:hypothetical protein F5H01DRAFT_332351 [Linnemannia elongata]